MTQFPRRCLVGHGASARGCMRHFYMFSGVCANRNCDHILEHSLLHVSLHIFHLHVFLHVCIVWSDRVGSSFLFFRDLFLDSAAKEFWWGNVPMLDRRQRSEHACRERGGHRRPLAPPPQAPAGWQDRRVAAAAATAHMHHHHHHHQQEHYPQGKRQKKNKGVKRREYSQEAVSQPPRN